MYFEEPKLIHKYKRWIREMHEFLKILDIEHTVAQDEQSIYLLHIPKQLKDILLRKTSSMGLYIHSYKEGVMMYTGLFEGRRDPAGISWGGETITIQDATDPDMDLSYIHETRKIRR